MCDSTECDLCGNGVCACYYDPLILSEPPSALICFQFEEEYRIMKDATTTAPSLVQADELVLTTVVDLSEHFKQESTKVVVSGPACPVPRVRARRAGKKVPLGKSYNETYALTMEAQKAKAVRKSL